MYINSLYVDEYGHYLVYIEFRYALSQVMDQFITAVT